MSPKISDEDAERLFRHALQDLATLARNVGDLATSMGMLAEAGMRLGEAAKALAEFGNRWLDDEPEVGPDPARAPSIPPGELRARKKPLVAKG